MNLAVIPYVSGGAQADYQDDTQDFEREVGMDAKIAISSSLNLDLTINPDFPMLRWIDG